MVVDIDHDVLNKFNDKEFRKALRADPKSILQQNSQDRNWKIADDIEIVVKTNTKDVSYVAMPQHGLSDASIESVSAAGTMQVSTVSSVGTAGTLTLTFLSVSTAGSAVGTVEVHT